jgi:IS30 family transposase
MSAYRQFSLYERNRIEEGLRDNLSLRKIGAQLGRHASSISRELKANRSILKGRGNKPACPMKDDCKRRMLCALCEHDKGYCQHCGEYDCRLLCPGYIDKVACPTLLKAPWTCNSCKRYRYGCTRPLRFEYKASVADQGSSVRRSEARRGVDMDADSFNAAMEVIRPAIARGMSPYEIATAYASVLKVSTSTIYRWVERGYGGTANIELERKVGFAPRRHEAQKKMTHHGPKRSFEAFCALPQDEQGAACEMDTVEGKKADSACILTLYLRPSHFQLFMLLASQSSKEVKAALDTLEVLFGLELFKELFGTALTDNGYEFEDTEGLEGSFECFAEKRCRIFYCDPRQSQQKAGCEKAHSELRQILPKRSVSFDTLNKRDISLTCSHVNSTPRKSLCGLSPIRMLKAAYGDAISDALLAIGITEVSADELVLKPRLLNDERAWRGEGLLDFNPPKGK